ncbi:S1C family serine protease [Asticcacaulis solisilvae]|uniref:S1C family serine protease n=1 Tax=Asticcacaulis solisilvae TaxID=1217274 RepID=UPI003FD8EE48
MHSHVVFAAVRRLSAGWLAVLVLAVAVAGFSATARAEDMQKVYELTPQEALKLLTDEADRNFAPHNITPLSSGIGLSVHTQVIIDWWDTDISIREVEFNLMPDKVIHGVTVSTHSGGSSFLTGRLINDHFISRLQRKFETSAKVYAVAPARVREINSYAAAGSGGSDGGEASPPPAGGASGTGFVILDGSYIVTANHVVANSKTISAACGSEAVRSAQVLARDPANDIALLKAETPLGYHLALAEEGSAHTGDKVFTIGFPVPDILGTEGKYSEGVISALSGIQGAANVMQITTQIQPGNSGGALIDTNGHVIGIVTSTAAVRAFYENAGSLPQNVNWAVKSDYLRPLLIRYSATAPAPASREKLSAIELAERTACLIKVTY